MLEVRFATRVEQGMNFERGTCTCWVGLAMLGIAGCVYSPNHKSIDHPFQSTSAGKEFDCVL